MSDVWYVNKHINIIRIYMYIHIYTHTYTDLELAL